jgi:hypothetical protein
VLWILILSAIVYLILLRLPYARTGRPLLVGSIGVAFGLYICAHPAANAINVLFFERDALRAAKSDWPLLRWLGLNLFALLAGWVVVFAGIRRLVDRTT